MIKHYNIRISGKVQNVGFRHATMKTASTFNVNGFVRNESDGTVYIEAEGEEAQLDQFLNWCHKGPSWARVEKVNYSESNPENYKDFTVR